MHRLAATPGGWNLDDGVVFIEQTPAPIVLLTAADTDIQTLAHAITDLPTDFPALRVVNLLHLQQSMTIDQYAEDVLAHAQVIIIRLLGGRAYWSYGLEVVAETVQRTGAALIVLPGDDRPDADLMSHSTVPLSVANRLWRYLVEGGSQNVTQALQFIAAACLGRSDRPLPPQPVPPVGLYNWQTDADNSNSEFGIRNSEFPKVGILFYRAHFLAGNTAPIDALCQALHQRHLAPVPVFVSSLRDADVQAEIRDCFQPKGESAIDVLLNTTSFSLAKLDTQTPQLELWQQLNVPVLQVILSGGTIEQWQTQSRGLSPRDMAMNVALPEVDGRIISRAVSFKAVQSRHPLLETDVVHYQPVDDRVQFVADLAANWVRLRQTPVGDRRIALILANYPTRDGRLANGVGLDTPASCVEILRTLQHAGYHVETPPETADDLMQRLTAGITNDPEGRELRPVHQSVSLEDYQTYAATLPDAVQHGIRQRWGSQDATAFPISGVQLGNVFIGIQPARGYDQDPSLNYHAPDLEPTPAYLAFYYWVRQQFRADAIVHVGKHGNLEWLPGKSIALSDACYPEVAIGPVPHLYP
ncbi:cobaltochelatase subunit CobN, partial [Leptolyngbya sp. FACHB-36]|uniref:cobaltochelatase subunit CobN n=1 Tax=Leptolyngbya sp. FACHB-36 TaxID=2692808 RepID=UPI00167FFDD1